MLAAFVSCSEEGAVVARKGYVPAVAVALDGGGMQKVEAGTGCRPRQVIQRKNVVEIVIREGIKIAMDSGIYAIWSGR